jgi:two-component system, cell cycle sensor histidine kinase and response regulator CckA
MELEAIFTINGSTTIRRSMRPDDPKDGDATVSTTLSDQIVEQIPDMVFLKDAQELRFVRFNRAGEDLLGIPREEMYGKTDYDFFPQDQAEFFTEKDRQVLASNDPVDILEEPLQTANGERWLYTRKVRLLGEDGRPAYLLGISRDITAQKKAEEALAAAEELIKKREEEVSESRLLASQRLESLGVLAGGVAHDFNNLLVSMLGNTALARNHVPEGSPAWELIERIAIAADRAAELTRGMMAYSGQAHITLAPVTLQDIVSEVNLLLGVDTREFVDLELTLGSDLPDVLGNTAQLRQVVMNFVANAIDALNGQPGGISIQARTVETDTDFLQDGWMDFNMTEGRRFVMLEVADTGCGMDEQTRTRIFDPFFSTKETGHGLGLAAVKGIVAGHGGSLRVQSTPDIGTTMSVLLPIFEGAREPRQPIIDDELTGVHAQPQTWCILVVDDQQLIRDLLKSWLEAEGHTVLLASNGPDALEIFAERGQELDLIFLDITMPKMNGIEVLERIRASNTTLPVLLASGYLKQTAAPDLDRLGCSGFVQKPYRLGELGIVLAKILSTKE